MQLFRNNNRCSKELDGMWPIISKTLKVRETLLSRALEKSRAARDFVRLLANEASGIEKKE